MNTRVSDEGPRDPVDPTIDDSGICRACAHALSYFCCCLSLRWAMAHRHPHAPSFADPFEHDDIDDVESVRRVHPPRDHRRLSSSSSGTSDQDHSFPAEPSDPRISVLGPKLTRVSDAPCSLTSGSHERPGSADPTLTQGSEVTHCLTKTKMSTAVSTHTRSLAASRVLRGWTGSARLPSNLVPALRPVPRETLGLPLLAARKRAASAFMATAMHPVVRRVSASTV